MILKLAKKVFSTQQSLSCKNDWVLQLRSDLEECTITLSEEEIKCMKKEKFKSIVKKQVKTLAQKYLIGLRSKHFKSENLMCINSMKDYLKTEKINLSEKKLLFAMKTRAINVKTNLETTFQICYADYARNQVNMSQKSTLCNVNTLLMKTICKTVFKISLIWILSEQLKSK